MSTVPPSRPAATTEPDEAIGFEPHEPGTDRRRVLKTMLGLAVPGAALALTACDPIVPTPSRPGGSLTPSPRPTGTPTASPTLTGSPTPSPMPSMPTGTATPFPSMTPTPTGMPMPSTPAATTMPGMPSATPSAPVDTIPSVSPTPVPTSKPSSLPSGDPTLNPTRSPSATGSPSVQPTPSGSASAQPTPSGSASAQPTKGPTLKPSDGPLTKMKLQTSPEWHLARRVCGAPTEEIAAEIKKMGREAWLERQYTPDKIDDSRIDGYAKQHLGLALMSAKQAKDATNGHAWKAAGHASKLLMSRPIFGNRHLLDSTAEVLGDHVYVPINGKGNSFSAQHEQLIRTHAFGKFSELLIAVMTWPAMLQHLDNVGSTKERPNENLGRELLELFTVGVGKYTEADVKQSALLLTGHSMSWENSAYEYKPKTHHVGPLKIMGFSHPNATPEAGPEVLKAYLTYLAKHEATAQRLARRFAVRFVSDNPSAALVTKMAKAYADADTAIVPMLKVLFASEEFWSATGQKWRRPAELLNTMVRASKPKTFLPIARDLEKAWDLGPQGWFLDQAGHRPRNYHAVTGYPDDAKTWNTTNTTLTLWNLALHRAVSEDAELGGKPDWAGATGIKEGDKVLAAVKRATLQFTGYEWAAEDIAAVAVALRPSKPGFTEADAIDAEMMKRLPYLVRLIFASPYAFLR